MQILASLNTEKLREQDYPLDKILAVDRAANDFTIKVKPSNMMRRSTFSYSIPAVWQIQLQQVERV